ncbi:unnamed protein product [Symbiodinium sp. KB8]|nr:unnamed protein product [Symbiodinium sp. KB8]
MADDAQSPGETLPAKIAAAEDGAPADARSCGTSAPVEAAAADAPAVPKREDAAAVPSPRPRAAPRPASRASRGSAGPSSGSPFHERLYSNAKAIQERRERALADAQKQLTFTPSINARSSATAKAKLAAGGPQAAGDRLYEAAKRQRAALERQRTMAQDAARPTFSPVLSAGSRRRSGGTGRDSAGSSPAFERLYKQAQSQSETKRRLGDEILARECPFRPTINRARPKAAGSPAKAEAGGAAPGSAGAAEPAFVRLYDPSVTARRRDPDHNLGGEASGIQEARQARLQRLAGRRKSAEGSSSAAPSAAEAADHAARMHAAWAAQLAKREAALRRKEEAETAGLTFKPAITKASRQMASRRWSDAASLAGAGDGSATSSPAGSATGSPGAAGAPRGAPAAAFERLHSDAARQRARREAAAKQKAEDGVRLQRERATAARNSAGEEAELQQAAVEAAENARQGAGAELQGTLLRGMSGVGAALADARALLQQLNASGPAEAAAAAALGRAVADGDDSLARGGGPAEAAEVGGRAVRLATAESVSPPREPAPRSGRLDHPQGHQSAAARPVSAAVEAPSAAGSDGSGSGGSAGGGSPVHLVTEDTLWEARAAAPASGATPGQALAIETASAGVEAPSAFDGGEEVTFASHAVWGGVPDSAGQSSGTPSRPSSPLHAPQGSSSPAGESLVLMETDDALESVATSGVVAPPGSPAPGDSPDRLFLL